MSVSEIQKITEGIQKTYRRYTDSGLMSVYLWGSILSSDYDPRTSDIDSIGFVEEKFLLSREKEIQDCIMTEYGHGRKFGFHALYISELHGGLVKSNFAKIISPRLLLKDFPAWRYVAGKKLKVSDFTVDVPSKDEALLLQLDDIQRRLAQPEQIEKNQYIVKSIARLVDLVQDKRAPQEPFSYLALRKNISSEQEKKVVDAIFACKKSGWSASEYRKHTPVFDEYVRACAKR